MSKADDVYQEWHAKNPSSVRGVKVDMPQEVSSMGKAQMIAYRSGKWQKGNLTEDYEHDFTSEPTIYHEQGEGQSRKVSSLMRGDTIILLGTCIELHYNGTDGEEYMVPLKGAPKLVCTTDKKTLIILHKDGPIFIRGGSMVVTKRGIVK